MSRLFYWNFTYVGLHVITDHLSGSGREISPACMRVFVCLCTLCADNNFWTKRIIALDIWHDDSSWSYLGQVRRSRSYVYDHRIRMFLFSPGCNRLIEKQKRSRKTSCGTVCANVGGNDTVPISVRRGEALRSTEYCCSNWLFVEFSVLKWSARPRVRTF